MKKKSTHDDGNRCHNGLFSPIQAFREVIEIPLSVTQPEGHQQRATLYNNIHQEARTLQSFIAEEPSDKDFLILQNVTSNINILSKIVGQFRSREAFSVRNGFTRLRNSLQFFKRRK